MARIWLPGDSVFAKSLRGWPSSPRVKPATLNIDRSNFFGRRLLAAFYPIGSNGDAWRDPVSSALLKLPNKPTGITLERDGPDTAAEIDDSFTLLPDIRWPVSPFNGMDSFSFVVRFKPGAVNIGLFGNWGAPDHVLIRNNLQFYVYAGGTKGGTLTGLTLSTTEFQTIAFIYSGGRVFARKAGQTSDYVAATGVSGGIPAADSAGFGLCTANYGGTGVVSIPWAVALAGEISQAELDALDRDPYQTLGPANQTPFLIGVAAAGAAYTLTADAGSYTYTGTAATLAAGRKVAAGVGSYAYTGTAAGLAVGRNLGAVTGAYTYTGTAAGLGVGYVLSADSATYTYTGSDATLTYTPVAATLTAEAGSYTYTGQDATFKRGLALSAAGGTYSYTGQDATLTYTPVGAFTLTADSGAYTYTGQDAGSLRTYVIPASAGAYTYTGSAAGLGVGYKIAIGAGAYTYTGIAATFDRGYALAAGVGSYIYTGQAVDFDYSGELIWTEVSDATTSWSEVSDNSTTWTEI